MLHGSHAPPQILRGMDHGHHPQERCKLQTDLLKRISSALSSKFHILSPRGDTKGRTDCLEGVIHAYGTHEKNGLAIEIKDCILRSRGKTCVMTYEEWHRTLNVTTARLCTVVFRKVKGGYNGLEWVHVHETWLPGKAPWK